MDGNTLDINFKTQETIVVGIDELQANEYNPNRMPDTEMDLLKQSILKYGFLFPIITTWDEKIGKYRIVGTAGTEVFLG